MVWNNVLQRSILRPLPFITFICDLDVLGLVFPDLDIANYTSNNILHLTIWIRLLTFSWRRPSLSYRNQSIDLQSKSMDWFLYETVSVMKELNIWLVTFISFTSYAKVYLIHFIFQSPSHSLYHVWLCSYCIVFQPHCLFHSSTNPVCGN